MPVQKFFTTSVNQGWETPLALFQRLQAEFKFNVDLAAVAATAKCARFYSPEQDAFGEDWKGVCWLNPPYSRGEWVRWMDRALEQSETHGSTIVCLIPARTDTAGWKRTAMQACEVRFVEQRLSFLLDGEPVYKAPFPSAIVVFKGGHNGAPRFSTYAQPQGGDMAKQTLSQKQRRFTRMVGALIQWADLQGFELTFGEVWRTDAQQALYRTEGKSKAVRSRHQDRLAVDFNLFKNGRYMSSSSAYAPLGEFWKSLDSGCVWGGDWEQLQDGNHFEYIG